jgi:hypothetical protein
MSCGAIMRGRVWGMTGNRTRHSSSCRVRGPRKVRTPSFISLYGILGPEHGAADAESLESCAGCPDLE